MSFSPADKQQMTTGAFFSQDQHGTIEERLDHDTSANARLLIDEGETFSNQEHQFRDLSASNEVHDLGFSGNYRSNALLQRGGPGLDSAIGLSYNTDLQKSAHQIHRPQISDYKSAKIARNRN